MRGLVKNRASGSKGKSLAETLRPVIEYLNGRMEHMERMRFRFRYRVIESRYEVERIDPMGSGAASVYDGHADVLEISSDNVMSVRGGCVLEPGEMLRVDRRKWVRVVRSKSFLIGDIVPLTGGAVALDHLFSSGLDDISRPEWDWEPLEADREKGTILLSGLPDDEILETTPNTVVVRRQMRAVSILGCGGAPHLDPLRAAISGNGWSWPSVRPKADWDFMVLDRMRPGANAQMDMVDVAAATPDIAMMHGPPGSGKTTVLVELVARLVSRGERVLLVSSTHVAVDNVLERLMDARAGDASLMEAAGIMPLRVGHESRISPRVRCFHQDRLVREERTRLLSKLQGIDRDGPQEALYQHLKKDTGRTTSLAELVWRCSNLVCGTTQGVTSTPLIQEGWGGDPQFDTVIIDEASKATLQDFLVPAVTGARWVISGDLMQLSPYVDEADMESELRRVRYGLLGDEEADLIAMADKAIRKGGGTMMDIPSNMMTPAQDILRSRIGDELGIWPERGRKVTLRAFDDRRTHAMSSWQGKTWDSELGWRLRRSFELRLDRDASDRYMTQIMSMLPNHDAERSRILRKRLDDVISVAMPSIIEVLTGRVSAFQGIPPDALMDRELTLRYQHRMHPRISRVPRECIYGGRSLKDPPGMDILRDLGYDGLPSPLTWVQVDCEQGYNNSNEAEAQVTVSILEDLLAWASRKGNGLSIAVLTPYREQEGLLRDRISGCVSPGEPRGDDTARIDIDICTVDRFQGHEADVVIISLVRGHHGSIGHMDSLNRLNVAITRARYNLVLIGDRRTALSPTSPEAFHVLAGSADEVGGHRWN